MKLMTFEQWYEQNKNDYPCQKVKTAIEKIVWNLAGAESCECENCKAANSEYIKQINADKKKLEAAGIKIK